MVATVVFFKVASYETIVSGFHHGTNQYFNVNMSLNIVI